MPSYMYAHAYVEITYQKKKKKEKFLENITWYEMGKQNKVLII